MMGGALGVERSAVEATTHSAVIVCWWREVLGVTWKATVACQWGVSVQGGGACAVVSVVLLSGLCRHGGQLFPCAWLLAAVWVWVCVG
jgi:hypothetical protein